jgi:hypothetical protein
MFDFIQREDPVDAIAGLHFALRRISYRSTDPNVSVTATGTAPSTHEEEIGQKILNEISDKENSSIEALTETQANKYKATLLDVADGISEQQFDSDSEQALEVFKEWERQRAPVKTSGGTPNISTISSPTEPPRSVLARSVSPVRLLSMLFFGLGVSVLYGFIGMALSFYFDGKGDAQLFFAAYTSSFKTLFSLGLIIGTGIIIYSTQGVVPSTIEQAFSKAELSETNYFYHKQRYFSLRRSLTFSGQFIVVGLLIFRYCQFPLSRTGEAVMVIAACAEYALGAYVGRKMLYTVMMLHSLLEIRITRNLFRSRELDPINTYVQIASALMALFVYVHVIDYYRGPFVYGSIFGQSIRSFLLLPAIIAMPISTVFTFYPRTAMRVLYRKSIAVGIQQLKRALRQNDMSSYERRLYLLQVDKKYDEDIRSTPQIRLSDVPIVLACLALLASPLLTR